MRHPQDEDNYCATSVPPHLDNVPGIHEWALLRHNLWKNRLPRIKCAQWGYLRRELPLQYPQNAHIYHLDISYISSLATPLLYQFYQTPYNL